MLHSTSQSPWDIVHWELWHRAVTFRANYSPFQSGKPNARYKGKQSRAKGVCWTFNAGHYCTMCRYEHKCHKCGGKDTWAQCQSTATGHNGEIERQQLNLILNSPPVTPVRVSEYLSLYCPPMTLTSNIFRSTAFLLASALGLPAQANHF